MGRSLQVEVYRTPKEIEGLRPAWNELLDHCATATIFSTWEWLFPWWQAFGEGRKLVVLAFFDSSKRLVALAPMSLATLRVAGVLNLRLLRLLGDGSGDSDNLDMPVRRGFESDFASSFLNYLDRRDIEWNLCELNTLPSDSAAGREILNRMRETGWTPVTHHQPCSTIRLPDRWESYLEQISKKEKDKLRYYSRRIEKRYRARFYKCTQESEISPCLDALFDLHRKRWQQRGEAGVFATPARRQFYEQMSRNFLARNWLEFWLLDLDGKTVAAQFAFRHRDRVFALQEGFDPAFSGESVGFVLRGHALKQCIADGVAYYDFLAGKSESKERWAVDVLSYTNLHFARPFGRGDAYLRLVNGAAAGKEWLRAHAPPAVWAGLHWLNLKRRRSQDTPSKSATD